MSLKNQQQSGSRSADELIPMDDLFGRDVGRTEEGVPDLSELFGNSAAEVLGEPPISGVGAGVKGNHANKFRAKRSLEQRQQSLRDNLGDIAVCIFCDDRCSDQITNTGRYEESKEYFDDVIDEMNTMLHDLDDSINLEVKFMLIPGMVVELSWFMEGEDSSRGEDLLDHINEAFWVGTGLNDMAVGYGCDVEYLVGASNDPAWNHMGSVAGIAGMFQMCMQSFSTVEFSSDPTRMAQLMSHEMGHLMGIYHDGPLDSSFTSLDSYFQPGAALAACAAEYTALTDDCTWQDVGCEEWSCIMDPAPSGSTFSDCSKAYYNMWQCLIEVMPQYYSDACVGDK